jgi:para-aminobenzoate synthetase component 1
VPHEVGFISLFIQEIPWRRPEDYFASLHGAPHLIFLDSAAAGDARSNASYLCFDPVSVLRSQNGVTTIGDRPVRGDPLELLREAMGPRIAPQPAPLPFTGGAAGFFGYELGRNLQQIATRHSSPDFPDMVVGLYDSVIGFDHKTEKAWLMLQHRPGSDFSTRSLALSARLRGAAKSAVWPDLAWQPDFDRETYLTHVETILEYIRAGDIFQANFTLRHRAKRPENLDTIALYLALRAQNPAPFAAYLDCGLGLALLSASPERFLSLDTNRQIEARPIKGTRPRDADPLRDLAFAKELAESSKDRAENLMIVDLLRNDIGQVAEIGSVQVSDFCQVEHFANVHHLVSGVTGKLRPGLDAVDLLRATLPGGSVTGAPKIRAMQIIDELETCARGPYCGAVAWLGFDGAMDSSIIIRTLIATPSLLLAQAGGGIVADSAPEAEYAEMMVKLASILGPGNG